MLEFDAIVNKLHKIIKEELPKNVLMRVGEEASNTFEIGGGRPIANYITNRSYALFQALRGGNNSEDSVELMGDETIYKRKINLIQGNLLHNGGSIPITKRSQIIAAITKMKAAGYYTKTKPYTATKGQFTYRPRPFINMGMEKVATKEVMLNIISSLIKINFSEKVVVNA